MAGLNGTVTIVGGEYRPCMVDGAKALFHKWVNKEQFVLKLNTALKQEAIHTIRKMFEEKHIVPSETTVDKISATLAIIEFEDGTIKEVEPQNIRFLDGGNLFYENALFFEEGRKEK